MNIYLSLLLVYQIGDFIKATRNKANALSNNVLNFIHSFLTVFKFDAKIQNLPSAYMQNGK